MENYIPPQYTVRKSAKAKSTQLKITSKKGLEVVIPSRMTLNVEKFLYTHRQWIAKNIHKVPKRENIEFPEKVELKFFDIIKKIDYQPSKGKCKLTEGNERNFIFSGDLTEIKVKRLLKAWFIRTARAELIPYLDELSDECGLPYNRGSVRGQSTIWGSCSEDKKISLNYKLLLLPTECVRYILIHELCHTIHLDHSRNFWNLVEKFESNYKIHKKLIDSSLSDIPTWLE